MRHHYLKRIAAILLLGIFSFNIFGYQLVSLYFENQSDKQLELAFDEQQYNDHELISIKKATNLPYYNNSAQFQRIDGEVEMDGVAYKYVKCRIYNDSLELLCLPNAGKMQIREAKAEFSKLASDFQQLTQKKKSSSESKSVKKGLGDYDDNLATAIASVRSNQQQFFATNTYFIPAAFTMSAERPPSQLA